MSSTIGASPPSKAKANNLLEAIEDLRSVLVAQETLLSRFNTGSGEWYAQIDAMTKDKQSPIVAKHVQNQYKTTLGILLLENKIDHLLPGGPAFLAGLRKGDLIQGVDGKTIALANIQQALVASDKEGEKVEITFDRAGVQSKATLSRMPVARVQSVRDIFDMMAQAQQHAREMQDDIAFELNDEIADGLEQFLIESHKEEMSRAKKFATLVSELESHAQRSNEALDRIADEATDSHYHTQMLEHDLSNLKTSPQKKLPADYEEIKEVSEHRSKIIQELETHVRTVQDLSDRQKKAADAAAAKAAAAAAAAETALSDAKDKIRSLQAQLDALSKPEQTKSVVATGVAASTAALRAAQPNPLTGKRVVITGLVGKPELNGRAGTAVSFDDAEGRYSVELDGEKSASFMIKPSNLCRDSVDHVFELIRLTKDLIGTELMCSHTVVGSPTKGNATTIGIMFDDKSYIIENTLVGGPAFNSKKVFKGDIIVSVDGTQVNEENIMGLLKGVDKPESVVTIGLKRTSGNVEEVKLRRMANAKLADKRLMFDLYTTMVNRAKFVKDTDLQKCVQEVFDHWTAQMEEEFLHDEIVASNVHEMQRKCDSWIVELLEILELGKELGAFEKLRQVQVKTLTRAEYGTGFKEFDTDGDGFISKAEFKHLKGTKLSFEELDTNGDGKINQDEYNKGFDKLDVNGHGTISVKEFKPGNDEDFMLDKLNRAVKGEKERRQQLAQRIVRRLLHSQLANAFESYAYRVSEVRRQRQAAKRVVLRMQKRALAGAFDMFIETVGQLKATRQIVLKAMGRWRKKAMARAMWAWMEYVEVVTQERKDEALKYAKSDERSKNAVALKMTWDGRSIYVV